MPDLATIERFLTADRIAVVGASDTKDNFGRAVYEAFRDHGHRVVAVNPNTTEVSGDPCYPTLADVPGGVDAVVVMVGGERAASVLRDAAAAGVHRVWLFKGIGGPGAATEDNVALARSLGLDVVDGACPLMFLEPVALVHRFHRGLRRARGALTRAA